MVDRSVLSVVRAIPDLLYALIFVAAVGIGPLPGIAGARPLQHRRRRQAAVRDRGRRRRRDPSRPPGRAARRAPRSVRWAVLPQVLPNYVAFSLYAFELNIRASTVIGIVGAGGIGDAALHAVPLLQLGATSRSSSSSCSSSCWPSSSSRSGCGGGSCDGRRRCPRDAAHAARRSCGATWCRRRRRSSSLWAALALGVDLADLAGAARRRLARSSREMFLAGRTRLGLPAATRSRRWSSRSRSPGSARSSARSLSLPLGFFGAKNVSQRPRVERRPPGHPQRHPRLPRDHPARSPSSSPSPGSGRSPARSPSASTRRARSASSPPRPSRASTRDRSRPRARPARARSRCSAGASCRRCCPRWSAFWLYRFEINIRAAAVLGRRGRRRHRLRCSTRPSVRALPAGRHGHPRRRRRDDRRRRHLRHASGGASSRAAAARPTRPELAVRHRLASRPAADELSASSCAPRETREAEEVGTPRPGRACARSTRAVASAPRRRTRMRTLFERDRDRIMHSKAFRRLKHKTQVFVDPEDDHYVTRLTHTHPGDADRARARRRAVAQRGRSPRRSRWATTSATRRSGTPARRRSRRTSRRPAAGTTPPRACASSRSSRTST